MGQAFGQLLPIALAAAVSSAPITAMILILLSPKRDEAAIPFLIGWVLGAAVVLIVATLAAQTLPDSRPRQPQTAIGVLEILIGAALIVLAILALRRRHEGENGQMPKWARAIGSFGAARSFEIGLALNVRPKGLLLTAAASLTLRSAAIGFEGTVFLIAVYTAIATSTVTAPIVASRVSPDRMEPRLIAARGWLTANGSVVTALIMIMIGVVVLGAGLGRL